MRTPRVYNEDEILDQLPALRGWSYVDGSIQRTYRTASFKSTLMVVATIGHLCEAAWHHPEMIVSFNTIVVRLTTHSAKAVTDKDFALAEKIEEVIGWQPGAEDGPLDGTPGDPRHAYLRHD